MKKKRLRYYLLYVINSKICFEFQYSHFFWIRPLVSFFKLPPPPSSRQGLSASSLWPERLGFSPSLPQEQYLQQHHVLCGAGRRSRDSLTTDPGPASVAPRISCRNQTLGARGSSSRVRAVRIQIHAAPAGCFTVQSSAKGKYFLTARAEPFSFNFNM